MGKSFNLAGVVIFLFSKWKLVTANVIIVSLLAVVYSFFLVGKQFVSSITFLPPFEENSILNLVYSGMIPSTGSSDIMPQHITTIFSSKSFRHAIIDKYNFYEKYKLLKSKNKFELALKGLKKDLTISSEELGSLGMTKPISFTINCFHTSPDSACEIIKYAFSQLDSTVNEVSIDRGRRNRLFVEEQLQKNKQVLDSLNTQFKQFQLDNKVYDVTEQVQLTLNNYGNIKAQQLANELQMQVLKKDYSNNYPLVQSLKKENDVLVAELKRIENLSEPSVVMGLENSVELMPKYLGFLRDIEVQNKLILIITQQLEEAKIKEARNVSSLKIVDHARVPEYKNRPKRIFLCASIISVYMIFVFIVLLAHHFYQTYFVKTPLFNEIIGNFKKH